MTLAMQVSQHANPRKLTARRGIKPEKTVAHPRAIRGQSDSRERTVAAEAATEARQRADDNGSDGYPS